MKRLGLFLQFALVLLLIPISWDALHALSQAQHRDTRALQYLTAARDAEAAHQPKLAIAAYQQVLSLKPADNAARLRLTLLQCKVSAEEPASLSATSARTLALRLKTLGLAAEDGPEVAVALAQIQLLDGRSTLAHGAFEKAGVAYPKSALVQFVVGKSRLFQGDSVAATDALARAAKLDPENSLYRSVLGKTLHAQSKWARAEVELLAAAERREDPMVRLMLGEAQLKLKKADAAIESLHRAQGLIKEPSQRARALAALGYAQYTAGRMRDAIASLSESHRLKASDQTKLNLALSYQALKDHKRSILLFKTALENRPLDGTNHVNWIRSLIAVGQRITAQQVYLRLKQRAENYPQLKPHLALMAKLVEMEKPDR